MNNIPPNWSWVKLGDVYKLETGNTPPKKEPDNYGNYLPFVKPPQLINDIVSDTEEFLSEKGTTKGRVIPKDSILVSCIGNLGKVGLNKFSVAFNQQINGLICNPKISSKFTFYFCQSQNFKNQLEEVASATTIPIVNKGKFSQLKIPLPPLPEQKKIVEKIEELFSGLDSGVASLKKAKEQIRLYRQSVLASAFRGSLNPGTAGRHDSSDYKMNRIKEKDKSGKSINPENPQILNNPGSDNLPDGWKWVKLGEVLEVKDGTHDTPEYKEKGIPFITQKNIKNGEFVFDNYNLISKEDHQQFYKRSNVTFNDIIISMIGANRGMSTIVKTKEIFSIKNVGLIKSDEKKFLAKYLDYFFKSEIGQNSILSKSKGGAQQFIGLTELRNWSVPQQSLLQQTQIVSEIEKQLSEADNLEKAIDDSLEKSEALSRSILKQAFEGKLV